VKIFNLKVKILQVKFYHFLSFQSIQNKNAAMKQSIRGILSPSQPKI